jgi:hypothetical protein
MKTLIYILYFYSALFFSPIVYGQQVDVRGSASVPYKDKVSPEIRNLAIEKARLKAVENYFAQGGEAETENFDRNLDLIEKNIEKFTSDPVVINDKDDPATKRFSIVVRVQLNVARLRNTIKGSSAVASTAGGEKSKIVFVFVGREVGSVQIFDDRVVKQSVASATQASKDATSKRGKESENITSNSVSTSAAKTTAAQSSQEISGRTEVGGSTTRRADQVSRVVFETNDLNVSIKGAFSQAGFDVRDSDFVLSSQLLTSINKEFATGNKVTPDSLKAVANALRQNSIPYFVIATLDVGRQDKDDATGMPRTTVSVSGEIYDLSDWPPKTVGAVPPFQVVGIGPDPDQAKKQALKKASADASRELISRMNVSAVK